MLPYFYSYIYHMNRVILLCFLSLCIFNYVNAQEESVNTFIDDKYREDQFYAGFSYSMLSKLPEGTKLRGLSGSIQFGFLRDIPINKKRNIALAMGVGLNFNRYGQNLFIGKDGDKQMIYRVLGKEGPVQYSTNRLGTSIVEFPIQFRWRTSSADKYQFWRIYGGVTAGYLYWSRSTFKQSENTVIVTKIPDIQKLRWSATLSFGYNKINFFAKYDLNNLFQKEVYTTDGTLIEIRPLQFGFIFYIL